MKWRSPAAASTSSRVSSPPVRAQATPIAPAGAATIDAARAGVTSPLEQVSAATRALCAFAVENRAVFRVVFGRGGAYHEIVRRAQAMFAADVERTLRDGIDAGVFEVASPALAAQALVGMSTQLLAWWAEHDTAPIADIEAIITQLSLRGVGRAGARS